MIIGRKGLVPSGFENLGSCYSVLAQKAGIWLLQVSCFGAQYACMKYTYSLPFCIFLFFSIFVYNSLADWLLGHCHNESIL